MISAVIVAAGKGRRMGTDVPKQFLELAGKPVLAHTLEAFEKSRVNEVIIVTVGSDIEYVRHEIVEKYGFSKVVEVIEGGLERYDSSFAGISEAWERINSRSSKCDPEHSKILIHDAVRALITPQEINRVIDALAIYDAVCPGMPVKDTVRLVTPDGLAIGTEDRSLLKSMETPQGFKAEEIYKAYLRFYRKADSGEVLVGATTDLIMEDIDSDWIDVTDDASVAQRYSEMELHVCEGDYTNIKLTTPEDLIFAEAILAHRALKQT